MYRPRVFVDDRPEVLHGLLRQYPFATLVTQTAEGIRADHLPLLFEIADTEHGVLRGHVARANSVWREAGGEALAIFQGPHAYISPSWYVSKEETHRVVPTWNYEVVQARGPLRWIEEPGWLHEHLERMTERHEAHRAQPWRLDEAPDGFLEKRARGVVGLEIRITELLGKRKLGQNKSAADRRSAIEGLRRAGDPASRAVAERMAEDLDQ